MVSFSASVFFFMYACAKQISASEPNLLARDKSLKDGDAPCRGKRDLHCRLSQCVFAPLDYSSTYGSSLSLDAVSSLETDTSPIVMITSHCISPIARWKPRRKPVRYKTPRCYRCNRPGHFAFHCL